MNLFEVNANLNLNLSETAKQLYVVKQLAKQLNEEIKNLEYQIEIEKEDCEVQQ